ncbi:hydroxymethylglutaryl-CoA lyase [Amylibacter sp. SFDW26]|uniref:hydroxymethylglutaryl-CoA lyase n=1 Tax=Amylibacter sp. SFDW26 TaxID=2652722 RepID=UPI001261A850|nr:hydroxymethylglutaryl-CoA lyase [Amylibacter sp. SFDW26]KAB7613843.1 hydroxymethylglutaryl-CoA lyase [Amylibacter sp. SFDW26]
MSDRFITVYEVGPRDGLQNEATVIPTADKIALINMLSETGLSKIETTSFVSPKWVPQMGDAVDVMQSIKRYKNVTYAALVPNLKGLDAAIKADVDEVAIFGSASESFSQKNINCSIAESFERFKPVAKKAIAQGVKLRGYVSCVVACPYEGSIAPQAVLDVANALFDMGCYEVSLGDTIGIATEADVARLLDTVTPHISGSLFAGHFHDTKGNALENVQTSLPYGMRTFDSAIGGLGGCPYAPGAKGNVSTVPLVEMLHSAGWETGLNIEKLYEAQALISLWSLGGHD